MTAEHTSLEDIVQKELVFSSIDAFVKEQTCRIFQQRFDETQFVVAQYEAKYGMSLAEFQNRIVDQEDETLKHFGLFEKEDDLFDWEVEDHALPYHEQRIKQLSA